MSIQQARESLFAQLPVYWKVATLRCLIYSFVVANSTFDAGVEGYDSFSEMNQMQLWRLTVNVITSILATWVAFLDQSMTGMRGSNTLQITAKDIEATLGPKTIPQAEVDTTKKNT